MQTGDQERGIGRNIMFALLSAIIGIWSTSAFSQVTVKVNDDRFAPFITYETKPPVESGSIKLLVSKNTPYLTSSLSGSKDRKTGEIKIYASLLVLHISRGASRFSEGRTITRSKLVVTNGKVDINCSHSPCSYSEIVLVSIPLSDARKTAGSKVDFEFKLFGENLSVEVSIPFLHFSSILAEMEKR